MVTWLQRDVQEKLSCKFCIVDLLQERKEKITNEKTEYKNFTGNIDNKLYPCSACSQHYHLFCNVRRLDRLSLNPQLRSTPLLDWNLKQKENYIIHARVMINEYEMKEPGTTVFANFCSMKCAKNACNESTKPTITINRKMANTDLVELNDRAQIDIMTSVAGHKRAYLAGFQDGKEKAEKKRKIEISKVD